MLRSAIAVFALLLACSAEAQTATPGGGAQNNGNGTQSATTTQGAAPSRANGVPPSTQPSGAQAQPGTATGNAPAGTRSRRARKPARNANSKVEIIGAAATGTQGSVDRPLLPIASLSNSLGIPSGTPIKLRLKQSVDSGHTRNGDMLNATLAEPLGKLPAGTPVQVTVVQASAAGALMSYGELSIQVVSIGGRSILSETITALGEEGKKEQADSAPARGTEAIFSADQTITIPTA